MVSLFLSICSRRRVMFQGLSIIHRYGRYIDELIFGNIHIDGAII